MLKTIHFMLRTALVGLSVGATAGDTETLSRQLESVPSAEMHVYRLKDSHGEGMDCLKVFQPGDERYAGVYYGVYHNLQHGVLATHLARSTDLHNWSQITVLDAHASQPTIYPCADGAFLLAYEHDEPNSVWIRIRYYQDLSDLSLGKHQRQFDIARTLAPTAEGTPSFVSVKMAGTGVDTSEIRLRFHYFQNTDVDQLARGTLTDFKSWKARPAVDINSALIQHGWRGNLGDRDRFTWQDQVFYLQEVQQVKGDWGSWRLCLCDRKGMPIRPLTIQTHQGSTAFSNPSVTWVTDARHQAKLVVTLFLLSEGNPPAEVGTLLYVINPSRKPNAPNQELQVTEQSTP